MRLAGKNVARGAEPPEAVLPPDEEIDPDVGLPGEMDRREEVFAVREIEAEPPLASVAESEVQGKGVEKIRIGSFEAAVSNRTWNGQPSRARWGGAFPVRSR